MNPFPPSPSPLPSETPADATPQTETPVAAAVMKFKSCRGRCAPEDGEFGTHLDVLPFAGKVGFKADSWCPSAHTSRGALEEADWAAERAGY